MAKLTFERLREQNSKRNKELTAFSKCKKWSVSDWLVALTGELGEFCNEQKKINRGDKKWKDVKENATKEIADILLYLDLLANHLNISLEETVIQKFNEVSDKRGSKIKL